MRDTLSRRSGSHKSIDGIGAYDLVSRNAMFRGVVHALVLRVHHEDDESRGQGEGGEQGHPWALVSVMKLDFDEIGFDEIGF